MDIELKLKDLFFGETAAEDELQREHFETIFFDDESRFEKLQEPKNFIVIGEKGTGKTMLGSFYSKKMNQIKNQHCEIINSGELLMDKLKEFSDNDVTHEYRQSFIQWLLLSQTAKLIVENHPILSKIPFTHVRKLNKILHSNEYKNKSLKNTKIQSATHESTNSIQSKSLSDHSTTITTKKGYNLKPKDYFDKIDDLKKYVYKQMKRHSYSVIFDDLDSLSEPHKSQEFYKFIDTLLIEGKSLNQKFATIKKREDIKQSKYLFLLRRDVSNSLNAHSHNFAKIETTNSIGLYWLRNYQKSYEHPILQIIFKKIRSSNQKLNSISDSKLYSLLFPETINNTDFISYFTKYTRGRPRDFILFLNTVAESFPDSNSFSAEKIMQSLPDYSKKFMSEIQNEMVIKTPEERALLETGIKLLSDMKKRKFQIATVKSFYNNHKTNYAKIDSIEDLLHALYNSSIIGNTWTYRSDKPQYSFVYRDNSLTGLNLAKNMIPHHALFKTLNI
ncbi:P-loop ATPase, Sll1717 family [Listeria newyorkensis]|uniref:P-loop ATPase, Sll1717 family n=1 Tax=Listeria newyorkensis TaxID=1497681 RepID=UPI00051DB48F|nr:hypothetical protein [Listeria newyorkensis]KGL44142.1 hypothetical protein EP58_06755 [Listeria newyorkensis]SQC57724.1 Uncharacterised protein [Listeria newyorkensis]